MIRRVPAFFVLLAVLLLPASASAQPRTNPALGITLGAGFSFPDDDSDVSGSGFYGTVEYVKFVTRWIGLRPYAGLMLTSPDEEDARCAALGLDCKVTANIGFFGGKV